MDTKLIQIQSVTQDEQTASKVHFHGTVKTVNGSQRSIPSWSENTVSVSDSGAVSQKRSVSYLSLKDTAEAFGGRISQIQGNSIYRSLIGHWDLSELSAEYGRQIADSPCYVYSPADWGEKEHVQIAREYQAHNEQYSKFISED